jgi:hypothetical protein
MSCELESVWSTTQGLGGELIDKLVCQVSVVSWWSSLFLGCQV